MATKRITDLATSGGLQGSELVEVSRLSNTVRVTGTTLSAQASDNSFNDSAAGFIAAGFAVGDRVNVAGFTGNAANNIFVGVVTALTADKMTIGGADGDVIVDDAAGESVTISKWVSRRTTARELGGVGTTTVLTVSGTTANLEAADVAKYHRFTNTSAKTLTVRPQADHTLPDNGEWHIRNVGASNLTITPGSGVTINPPAGGTLVIPPGGTVTLKRAASDVFDLLGQTVAA